MSTLMRVKITKKCGSIVGPGVPQGEAHAGDVVELPEADARRMCQAGLAVEWSAFANRGTLSGVETATNDPHGRGK